MVSSLTRETEKSLSAMSITGSHCLYIGMLFGLYRLYYRDGHSPSCFSRAIDACHVGWAFELSILDLNVAVSNQDQFCAGK
jgi:hypothetical protein